MSQRIPVLDVEDECCCIYIRVSLENMFLMRKNWLNPLCKYLGVALKESERIFDFDNFWGVHKSFPF